jgi:serine protease Do
MFDTKIKNMRKFLLLALFFHFVMNAQSSGQVAGQSLGPTRISRLKQAVVRVLVDGKPTGTGFTISKDGAVLTCWHVIETSFGVNEHREMVIQKKISIEFSNGEIAGVTGIEKSMAGDGLLDAVGYDYCLLILDHIPKAPVVTLKIGQFDDIAEGDAIYTCGYPFGIKQQFISMGILSTKFLHEHPIKFNSGKDTILQRNAAWLDLTMNRGNSGGPIIKLGRTESEDEVIGIASFIVNPLSEAAEAALEYAKKPGGELVGKDGVSQSSINELYANGMLNSSYGISGCISIDYFSAYALKYLVK